MKTRARSYFDHLRWVQLAVALLTVGFVVAQRAILIWNSFYSTLTFIAGTAVILLLDLVRTRRNRIEN